MAPVPSHEITSCRVKIWDFSSAFLIGHEPKFASTTLPVTPPEALFDANLTISMDIWSLGCMLFEIVGDGSLLSAFKGEDYLKEDIAELLGALPGSWWERWEQREKFFTKDGKRADNGKCETTTREYRISSLRRYGTPSETSEVSKTATASLKALLSVMLVYKPTGRISLGEALNFK